MDDNEKDLLLAQLACIADNKPIPEDKKCKCSDMQEVQEGINYISECLLEVQSFFSHLCKGELDVTPPSRSNFYAGGYKELQSALKHLTWQADQIANGDYSQSVDFLGDFSVSFNKMIKQLKEREDKLKYQSTIMGNSVDFMKSVMNSIEDWIIVTDAHTHRLLFWNKAVEQVVGLKNLTSDTDTSRFSELYQYIHNYDNTKDTTSVITCSAQNKIYNIKSCELEMDGRAVYVHHVMDVTKQEEITAMAYLDQLTGLKNRRYLIEKLVRLRKNNTSFVFCMVDLDGLKYANDNFGHQAGDDYLITVAKAIKSNIRSSDVACRIGGDEFTVLFLNCSLEIAELKMSKIDTLIQSQKDKYPMSISYGAVPFDKEKPLSDFELMNIADDKMYKMKKARKGH